MPIYEYRCNVCGAKSSLFFRSFSTVGQASCQKCGSADLRRLVSRFAVAKSEESRLDDLADPSSFGDVDENDPRSIARWAKKMGAGMGEDMGPEFDEMIERMEQGEMPDELMGEGGDGFGGGDDSSGDLE